MEAEAERIQQWGERLAELLLSGGRLLAAGNGGSAAQAQHLTAELVGRYREERPPLSAVALHADTSALTAIAYDYGYEEHSLCAEAIAVRQGSPATVQEIHLVIVHMLCNAVDAAVKRRLEHGGEVKAAG